MIKMILSILLIYFAVISAAPIKNYFVCNDGDKIMESMVCDTTMDCADGKDEWPETCYTPEGAIEYLYCKDGKMVETGKFCDMVNDCEDGFDEENCQWAIKETSKGPFVCGNCPEWTKHVGGCQCSFCNDTDLCNGKDKGTITHCFGGEQELGKFKTENCGLMKNDGCHTLYFDYGKQEKGCGKCPAEVPTGSQCVECDGEMCNKNYVYCASLYYNIGYFPNMTRCEEFNRKKKEDGDD